MRIIDHPTARAVERDQRVAPHPRAQQRDRPLGDPPSIGASTPRPRKPWLACASARVRKSGTVAVLSRGWRLQGTQRIRLHPNFFKHSTHKPEAEPRSCQSRFPLIFWEGRGAPQRSPDTMHRAMAAARAIDGAGRNTARPLGIAMPARRVLRHAAGNAGRPANRQAPPPPARAAAGGCERRGPVVDAPGSAPRRAVLRARFTGAGGPPCAGP